MPESIISQFRREYNSPIETDRQVNNINARDAINILTRWEGMNVYVISEGITYSLVGGLDNTNWVEVAGIGEAPIDGQAYIRKDGAWELMPVNSGVWGSITGTLSDQTDLQSALNAKPNISGDNGNSGITLIGLTSGSYTVGTQEWRWSRVGNITVFYLWLNGINGSTATGDLVVDFSSTTIPTYIGDQAQHFNVIISGVLSSVSFYSIKSRFVNDYQLNFLIQAGFDGTNGNTLANVDFTSARIEISGTYISSQ